MMFFASGVALAQMVFEVASIRPADAETMRSGQFHRGSKGE